RLVRGGRRPQMRTRNREATGDCRGQAARDQSTKFVTIHPSSITSPAADFTHRPTATLTVMTVNTPGRPRGRIIHRLHRLTRIKEEGADGDKHSLLQSV